MRFLALFFCIGTLLAAQTRIISHVTRAGGDFTSTLLIANHHPGEGRYQISAFNSGGQELATVDGSIFGKKTSVLALTQLFPELDVSHLVIDGDDHVVISISYRANLNEAGPAQVQETGTQAAAWQFYQGEVAVTWDGLAAVNTGSAPTDLTLRQLTADGQELQRETLVEGLQPMGKFLANLSLTFANVPNSSFELSASQPLSVTVLRGAQAGTFLWSNGATEIEILPVFDDYELENAFPNLFFPGPVDLQAPNDQSNRLFIVEQAGKIRVIENPAQADSAPDFLDIQDRVTMNGEMGLLGLAFHPNYQQNGLFYVNYTTTVGGPRRTVISSFTIDDPAGNRVDPASENVLLEFDQPDTNHNGGQLAFGPDGFLYIGSGDGGSGGDPDGHGQDTTSLLGNILRIDVDQGPDYGIPSDNPFVGVGQGVKEEIFAFGFRNPWRFSFDGDRLWAGDVGQDNREEISLVENGGNYGWNITEGNACFIPPNNCDTTGLVPPVLDYDHNAGDQSITGGYVYRGSSLPELFGSYIYGDFVSGRIWAMQYDGNGVLNNRLLLRFDPFALVSFGTDSQGELFACSITGRIYRLVPE